MIGNGRRVPRMSACVEDGALAKITLEELILWKLSKRSYSLMEHTSPPSAPISDLFLGHLSSAGHRAMRCGLASEVEKSSVE